MRCGRVRRQMKNHRRLMLFHNRRHRSVIGNIDPKIPARARYPDHRQAIGATLLRKIVPVLTVGTEDDRCHGADPQS